MPWFTWLTPPAPAAIAVLRCDIGKADLVKRWPEPGRAGFVHLRDPSGALIDEAVVFRLGEDEAEICVHGGPGMRESVSACFAAHGYAQRPALMTGDARWQALAAAPSPGALTWLLAHPGETPAFVADFLVRPPLVLITGPANAGKSTLLNAWCGHRKALVSDIPGTTRDLIAAETTIAGWRVRLLDSAGLRASDDALERAGQSLVEHARSIADLVLSLSPADQPDVGWVRPGDLVVRGKADLGPPTTQLCWSDRGTADLSSAVLLNRLGAAVLGHLRLPATQL